MKTAALVTLGLWAGVCGPVLGQTNSWLGGDGTWETKNNWSLNKRPAGDQDIVITNTGTFTVTVDDQTVSVHPSPMTAHSLALSDASGANTLLLTNRTSSATAVILTVLGNARIDAGSTLKMVDATGAGLGVGVVASNLFNNSTLVLGTNASLAVSNGLSAGTAPNQVGALTTAGGNLTARTVKLGEAAGSQGIWSILNGTNFVGETLQIGSDSGTGTLGQTGGKLIVGGNASGYALAIAGSSNSTGTVVLARGQLTLNSSLAVGENGFGILMVSNGFFQTGAADLGASGRAKGLWEIAGGSNVVDHLNIGARGGGTGEVVMTGGKLITSDLNVGNAIQYLDGGVGTLIISNGEIHANTLYCVGRYGDVGTVTVAGGRLNIGQNLYLGYYRKGALWQTGGEIDVTNGSAYSGKISLEGHGFGSQLICSGGVLNAVEVEIDADSGGSSPCLWSIAGGTSIVNRAVTVARNWGLGTYGLLAVSGGRLQTPELTVESGTMTVSGGQVQVTSQFQVGGGWDGTGTVVIAGGEVDAVGSYRSAVMIGSQSDGQLLVSSGTFNASGLWLGGASSAVGTLTIAGGVTKMTGTYSSSLSLGNSPASTGVVSVTGGTLDADTIWVGGAAGSVGVMSMSNGLVDAASGTWGTILTAGVERGSTGLVSYTGGNLHARAITLGDAGYGSMDVSPNADFQPPGVRVGNQSGAGGALTLRGGSVFVPPLRRLTGLQVGVAAGSTGAVWVVDGTLVAGYPYGCFQDTSVLIGMQGSGRLSATNSTLYLSNLAIGNHGTLECVNSRFDASYGDCPLVNSNVMIFVNSTGSFSTSVQNTGTIVANGSALTFFRPVSNTGCIVANNGSVKFLGGINNSGVVVLLPEQFRVTSITRSGSDVVITWPAFGGNHYRVQTSDNLTNDFSDITSDIVAAGCGLVTTNYVDPGGVTNSPVRFYRIRQVY
jgi:hypothetical protein